MNKSEAAHTFGVSLSLVKRYAKAVREGRSLAPDKAPLQAKDPASTGRRAGSWRHTWRSVRTQALPKMGETGEGSRGLGERIDPLAGGPLNGLWPKKGLDESERDEFLRATFLVMS